MTHEPQGPSSQVTGRKLIYCLPSLFGEATLDGAPGMERFRHFTSLYGKWVMPVDRTGVMRTPLATSSVFPLPQFLPLSKDYATLCDERAQELLACADALDIRIYVMYSGGIDSTCLMVSLLRRATADQRKRITVLLSHESIGENPRFYDEHIKGQLEMEPSTSFWKYIGTDDMLLSAEHNDLVFGSDKIGHIIHRYGEKAVHAPYSRDLMIAYFAASLGDNETLASFYVRLFERICAVAPVPIHTNLAFLWWVNFSFKWQACYYYILLLAPQANATHITQEYLDTRFVSFFNTEAFQLWSMSNLDKRIRDTWKSYKWPAKDIIYEYTKDAEYRDHKVKRGSLIPLTNGMTHLRAIDDRLQFAREADLRPYLDPDNDFI